MRDWRNIQRRERIVPTTKVWVPENAEILARCDVRSLAGHAQRRRVGAADTGLTAVPAMTSMQLLVLFAAVMLVLAIGAASVFI
jgi:hypothetical protein